ncbi:MAG: hypothetical protein ACRD0X_00835, partial [Thermoanaerobaculia bacterium]
MATVGGNALAALPATAVREAWLSTVGAFLDRESHERRALDPLLVGSCGLSLEGLDAGLAAVLGGVRGAAADELFQHAARQRGGGLV